MAESQIPALILKASSDEKFRTLLLEDVDAAIKQSGIVLTDEEVAKLKAANKEELEKALSDIDDRVSKSAAAIVGWV